MFRFIFLFLFLSHFLFAADSLFVNVHFVYGSKPKTAFRKVEKKQFGGIHGGHVYMEFSDEIISYGTNNGKWHIFPHKNKNAGKYRIDKDLKWHGDTGKLKITTIIIPISQQQALKFKETEKKYFEQTPYDYAFFGMRCAAGAYDILENGREISLSTQSIRVSEFTENFIIFFHLCFSKSLC